jgi:NDP-sugar pyrophosphorylase family protein
MINIYMSNLTVIIPAAGLGSRLGLPYSKEILRVSEGQSLIDFSFDFFKDYGRKDVEFVIVLSETKLDIIKYLSKYKDRFNISFTFQNPNEQEYTGAIKSAKHLFGEHNVVLLPDTLMQLSPGIDLFKAIESSLTETGFTFFYKKENNPAMLRTKGALSVTEDSIIEMYEDKPEEKLERFNAFWCSFAFRKRAFDQCIAFMEKSTLRQRVTVDEIKNTPLYLSKGIEVEDYIDLGTWPELTRFIRNA